MEGTVLDTTLQQHCDSFPLAPDCSLRLRSAMLLFPPAGVRANNFSAPHSAAVGSGAPLHRGLELPFTLPKIYISSVCLEAQLQEPHSHSFPMLCNALATLHVFFGCLDVAVTFREESSPRGGACLLSCGLVGSTGKENTVGSECHSFLAASCHLETRQTSRKVSPL